MNVRKIVWSKNFSSSDIDNIEHIIRSEGCLLMKEVNIDKESFEIFCRKIANPFPHDKKGSIIWDIKSKQTQDSKVITYSEHNHFADLHTDSQYSENPEDLFALLTLKKAQCGGGQSLLLSVDDILKELNSTKEGRQALHILSTTQYPFIVPNVFKLDETVETEFNFGSIFQADGTIRFRIDTVRKAIEHNPQFCSKEQVKAFEFLVTLIQNTKSTKRFFLNNNDLIFINNKTMLHGRTEFTDANRHLLRIRMNFKS